MTSVFVKRTPASVPLSDSVTLTIAPESNTILNYTNNLKMLQEERTDPSNHTYSIPLDHIKNNGNVLLRSDLIDCYIDICSPSVLEEFKENFDFSDLRSDFLNGYVLSEDEVAQWKVSPVILNHSYSTRVRDFRSYELVSRDIVNRWMYPIVPNSNFSYDTNFEFWRSNNYTESPVHLTRSSILVEDIVIGKNTHIGEKTIVSNSIIGRNVKIGKECTIRDCFIWDNVVIEDGVVLESCLLCNKVKICKNAKVSRGAVISLDVVIGPGFTVPEHARVSTRDQELDEELELDEESSNYNDTSNKTNEELYSDDDNFNSNEEVSTSNETNENINISFEDQLGKGGVGRIYTISNLEPYNLLGMTEEELFKLSGQKESEEEEEEMVFDREEYDSHDKNVNVWDHFFEEVNETMKRAISANHELDNTKLEINSLKLSNNTTMMDCAKAILGAIILYTDDGKRSDTDMLKLLQVILVNPEPHKTSWRDLISIFMRKNNTEDQIE